jgi:hypothetical protein
MTGYGSYPPPDIIGGVEASEILGIDRSTLSRWIAAGKIVPLQQLPTSRGAFLFIRADVEQLAAERTAKAAYTVCYSDHRTYTENGEIVWFTLGDARRLAAAIDGSYHRDSGVRWS